jgi:hypothetical protein
LARQQPELAKDFADLDRVSSQLATLAFAVPDPKLQEVRRRKMQKLTDDKERLEGRLAGRSAAFRQEQELRNLEPAQLQAVLPPTPSCSIFSNTPTSVRRRRRKDT